MYTNKRTNRLTLVVVKSLSRLKIEAMHPLTSDFHILASIKGPVKHEPVDQWDQDFAWRVQMGLGLHGKKMEAIRPLTSDYHMLASIQDPIKHQPVDQDCAWRVQTFP